jgi:hypothetical protein
MPLSDNIASFKTGDYTVTRTTASTRVMGRAVAGASSTFSIAASVRPLGRMVKNAPEGATAADIRKVYTTTQLLTLCPTHAADRISIGSESFTVYQVDGPFNAIGNGSSFYRCFVARQVVP